MVIAIFTILLGRAKLSSAASADTAYYLALGGQLVAPQSDTNKGDFRRQRWLTPEVRYYLRRDYLEGDEIHPGGCAD